MKQCSQNEQPGALEFVHQAMAKRVFMCKVFANKTADVADDLKNMLVNGKDVKQVVLHLTDNLAESRNISTKNVELVHQPQRMQHTIFLAQDLDE